MRRRAFGMLLGGTAASSTVWPPRLRAQQNAMRVVGVLQGGSPMTSAASITAAFEQGLNEAGYIPEQNVTFETRYALGRYDRLPALVADLVSRRVEVILATGIPEALAAKNATSSIPIVYASGGDPVAARLVTSLSRPGGNVTGITLLTEELVPKRFELIRELVPQATVVGLLVNPNNPNAGRLARKVQEAALPTGIRLEILKGGSAEGIEAAFAALAPIRNAALVVAPDPLIFSRRQQVLALAGRHKIPTIYGLRQFVDAGGLVSYGASLPAIYRQVGIYIGMILSGSRPAEMPIHRPSKFELLINLRTAKTLGITIPPSFLARVDEMIE